MTAASSRRTYSKMQEQLLEDDDAACMLVEAIAKTSQNIAWTLHYNGSKKNHRLIRRVSMDKFYELITGDALGFKKVCTMLPNAIQAALAYETQENAQSDTAYNELETLAQEHGSDILRELYLLGFPTYAGFSSSEYAFVSVD